MTEVALPYNYEIFGSDTAIPLLQFGTSPPIGQKAPDFPLWHLDGTETRLSEIWSGHTYTVVEFGSFT